MSERTWLLITISQRAWLQNAVSNPCVDVFSGFFSVVSKTFSCVFLLGRVNELNNVVSITPLVDEPIEEAMINWIWLIPVFSEAQFARVATAFGIKWNPSHCIVLVVLCVGSALLDFLISFWPLVKTHKNKNSVVRIITILCLTPRGHCSSHTEPLTQQDWVQALGDFLRSQSQTVVFAYLLLLDCRGGVRVCVCVWGVVVDRRIIFIVIYRGDGFRGGQAGNNFLWYPL